MNTDRWAETARMLVRPIPEMADELAKDLEGLSDICCVHFEKVAETEAPRGNAPKCVDCMARSGKRVYLIEFKPLPSEGGGDIPGSLALKALESAFIYRNFLSDEFGDLNLGFVLVVQDHRPGMVSVFRRRAGMDAGFELARYAKRDRSGRIMFYDTVEMMGCEEFVRVARKRFSIGGGPGGSGSTRWAIRRSHGRIEGDGASPREQTLGL